MSPPPALLLLLLLSSDVLIPTCSASEKLNLYQAYSHVFQSWKSSIICDPSLMVVAGVDLNHKSNELQGSVGMIDSLELLNIARNGFKGVLPHLLSLDYSFNYSSGEARSCQALGECGKVVVDGRER